MRLEFIYSSMTASTLQSQWWLHFPTFFHIALCKASDQTSLRHSPFFLHTPHLYLRCWEDSAGNYSWGHSSSYSTCNFQVKCMRLILLPEEVVFHGSQMSLMLCISPWSVLSSLLKMYWPVSPVNWELGIITSKSSNTEDLLISMAIGRLWGNDAATGISWCLDLSIYFVHVNRIISDL